MKDFFTKRNIRLGIIYCDSGNIGSLINFFNVIGIQNVSIIKEPSHLSNIDICIIPGVGHFATVINSIDKLELREKIETFANGGKLLIGICAGAQVLLSTSDESLHSQGLNLLPGHVRSLKLNNKYNGRIPRIGWQYTNWISKDLRGNDQISKKNCFYFAHSYELIPHTEEHIVALSSDGVVAAINHNNIWGLQFHPEKSQNDGFFSIKFLIKNYA